MTVERKHLAGLELALSIADTVCTDSINVGQLEALIEQAKAAPLVTSAETVAFVGGDDTRRAIFWHPDKPAFVHPVGTQLMTVSQHAQIVATLQADAKLYRQWFNAVQDLNPKYLEAADFGAAARLVGP